MKLLVVSGGSFFVSPSRLMRLQEMADNVTVHYVSRDKVNTKLISECEVIFGCPPPEMLICAHRLRWLHITSAGIEPYGDLRLYSNKNLMLTNSSGVFGRPVAEHVIGLFIALSRHFPYYTNMQNSRQWINRDDVKELTGANVAVLGLGDLGMSVVRKLKGFECNVFGVRKNIFDKPKEIDSLFPIHRLKEVLCQSDYVAACLPHTPETVGLMNKEAFLAMKPGAVFVNVGRGSLVVENDLADVIKDGHLMGAGLDVTSEEPLDRSSPLWGCENVLITSHSSAFSLFSQERLFDLFADLYSRFIAGRKLYNQVNFFSGY